MAYRYRSRRSIKKLARKSQRNFILTLAVVGILIYSTINWVLPSFIEGVGFIKNIIKPAQKSFSSISENAALAPPVLNIPFEATNSAEIGIKGFGTLNSKVNLYIDDNLKQTVDVLNDGSFLAEKVSLNLGLNNIYGKTLDETGKESLPSKTIQLSFIYDKPNLTINEPEDGKIVQGGDRKIKISGKTDPNVKIFINDNQIVVSQDGNFSTDININEGDNIISVRAVDTASNLTELQRRVNYAP